MHSLIQRLTFVVVAAPILGLLDPGTAHACSAPWAGDHDYKPGYPAQDAVGVPTNVAPVFSAYHVNAVGIFDASGAAVDLEFRRLGVASTNNFGGDGGGTDSYFQVPVNQLTLTAPLQPNEEYELVVVLGGPTRSMPLVLSVPPEDSSDAGAGDAGAGDAGAGTPSETVVTRFSTGATRDDDPPGLPTSAWLAEFYAEKATSASCLTSLQICVAGGSVGEGLLATLTYEDEAGQRSSETVFAQRTMVVMSRYAPEHRLVAGDLTLIDGAGNRSETVSLEGSDIPSNRTESYASCESKPDSSNWDDTLPDAGADTDGGWFVAERPDAGDKTDAAVRTDAGQADAAAEPDRDSGVGTDSGQDASSGSTPDDTDSGTAPDADDHGHSHSRASCDCRVAGNASPGSSGGMSALLLLAAAWAFRRRASHTPYSG